MSDRIILPGDQLPSGKRYFGSAQTYQKMPPKNKKAWVDALRSGEYVQGAKALCRVNGAMCCLGVAIDVLYEGDWVLHERRGFYVIDGSVGFPPLKATKAMGLDGDAAAELILMNDEDDKSFGEIANWIEQNL